MRRRQLHYAIHHKAETRLPSKFHGQNPTTSVEKAGPRKPGRRQRRRGIRDAALILTRGQSQAVVYCPRNGWSSAARTPSLIAEFVYMLLNCSGELFGGDEVTGLISKLLASSMGVWLFYGLCSLLVI